jgi:hypothetical protein
VPDLIAMLKRRSSKGMNPRMAAIMGVFQILWAYYGLLIASRPVIVWNVVAVFINFLSVGVLHFATRKSKQENERELTGGWRRGPKRMRGRGLALRRPDNARSVANENSCGRRRGQTQLAIMSRPVRRTGVSSAPCCDGFRK